LVTSLPSDYAHLQILWDQTISFCDIIMRASKKHELDPNLIATVIFWESGGNPQAGKTLQTIDGVTYNTSHSGAVGLMQVMPSQGIATKFMCPNGPCFHDRPTIAELLDPEFNIDTGSRLLAWYITTYGSVREGLKSYGPMDRGYEYADKVLGLYQKLKP
jgi:soluble lytic murein transglycosylase-like protein